MIEMRIVEIGDGYRPEFQYRHHLFATDIVGALHPPNSNNMWSEWKTAPYVSLMETQND
jgi:hypothetical protein